MESVIQTLVNGLSQGGTYALLALGLAIVFSILGLINFAHGELMTITGYTMFLCVSIGLPLLPMVVIGVVAAGIAAIGMERLAFRPFRGANPMTLLLTSFALSVVLQVLFQVLISARPKVVPLPESLSGAVSVGGIRVGIIPLISIALSVAFLLLLTLFLRRTTLGVSMRAAAEDLSIARLMGVRANAVVVTAFAVSGVLAGVAGVLWVAQRGTVDPLMGFVPVLKAFIVVVIGGLGSLRGAVIAGFLLGIGEVTLQTTLPEDALPYRDAFVWMLVIGVLLWRPSGLFTFEQRAA